MEPEYTFTVHDASTGKVTTRPMTDEEIAAMPPPSNSAPSGEPDPE